MSPNPIDPSRPRVRIAPPAVVGCPHCSAENPSAGSTCMECGKTLAIYIGVPSGLGSYSLGSLMVVVGTISLGLALARLDPVVGAAFFLIVVTSTIRTLHFRRRERAWGTPLSAQGTSELFIGSMGGFLLIWTLTVICAFAVGLATAMFVPARPGEWIVLLIPAVPTLLFLVWLCRALLPWRRW